MSKQEVERIDDAGIAAWNAKDSEKFASQLADKFVWKDTSLPEAITTKKEAKEYAESWFTAFPDIKIKLVNRVVTDAAVAGEMEFTGTNTGPLSLGSQTVPATGKKVVGRGAYFAKIEGGKISTFSTYPDLLGTMVQLGLAPM